MKPFLEWYEERHGQWPGYPGEFNHDIQRRIFDAQALYFQEFIDELKSTPTPKL